MKTAVKNRLYEAMFLLDSAEAASDWDGVVAAIDGILKRIGAKVVSIKKWDERKLAYDIRGKDRGAYILCYFRSDGSRNGEIEREVRLSERFMRVLILNAELMSQEDIEKPTPAMMAGVESRVETDEPQEEGEDLKEHAPEEQAENDNEGS